MEILQYITLHMTKKVLGKNPSEDPLPHPRTLNLTLTPYGGLFSGELVSRRLRIVTPFTFWDERNLDMLNV